MEPEFKRMQRAFAHHLRDPAACDAPVRHEARRLAIYENAIYANAAGLMADNYPRIRALFDDENWQTMLRDYVVRHVSRTSAFVDLPIEFLAYLRHEREGMNDPPYLYELAHFDWVETLVGADRSHLEDYRFDRDGDLLSGIPVVNPTVRILRYDFPVHAISPDYRPEEAPAAATWIAAFRDPDQRYGFLDLNPASQRLLYDLALNTRLSGNEVLKSLAADFGTSNLEAFVNAGFEILRRMHTRGAVLGTIDTAGFTSA